MYQQYPLFEKSKINLKKEINDLLPSYTKRKYGMEHKI